MKKIIISLVLCLILTLSMSAAAFADGESEATLPHVTDSAGILSESEAQTLETLALNASQNHGCSVYVITVDDYTKYVKGSIEDCAEAFFDYYVLGWGEEKNGIMLLMSMYDRDYTITAYGELAHASFTDYGKDALADMFLDNFRKDDWYGGFVDYVRGCDELLKLQEAGTPLDVNSDGEQAQLSTGAKMAIVIAAPCVVALIVCLIFLSQMKSAKLKTEANDYVVPNSLNLYGREDVFTHRTEVRQVIENNNRSGGGGGTSINAGGFSHHSGKF